VQVDGSEHWWFEDRGPQRTLLVFVDDATSRLMHLQFVESEATFAYFHAARAYLEAWGKPIAFYSDKHGVFRVNHPGALGGDGMTQFGRALHALNIDIICANSSPAKGRVERANKTLQDRLVEELRLAGAATLAEGNALLPRFIADYNTRFAKPPANAKDLHRPLRPGDDLDDAFAWKEERTLSRALILQYDKLMFILEPSEQAKTAIGKWVTMVDYPDGRLADPLPWGRTRLPYLRQDPTGRPGGDCREQAARRRACLYPRGAAAPRTGASQWTTPARSARCASL
jgi:hypothetical protein